jgi:hypothetical protein
MPGIPQRWKGEAIRSTVLLPVLLVAAALAAGCAKQPVSRPMVVTAYCGCSQCCEWERGSWRNLKLDFWNRYVSEGLREGERYTGLTADGSEPQEPQPGLFSSDSLKRPWLIPFRTVFFWKIPSRDGTIAADTRYYPFGTRMYIPGYGYGVVSDRGGAIKGKDRLDIYFDDHEDALRWGRRRVKVRILD